MKAVVETKDIEGDSASPQAIPAETAPNGTLPPTVVRLGWVSFLTDVSGEMIFPLIPAFLAGISGAPASALGWIEGVADATASTLKIVSGRLTDRAERKKPLVLFGYGMSSFVRPLVCLAGSWPVVLGVRFLDRVGKGVRSAPRDTLIAAAAPPGRRGAAFGLHRAFDNAGAVLGPLVATGLILFFGASFRTVFALSAIPAVMAVLVLVFGVHEVLTPPTNSGETRFVPLPSSFRRAAGVMTLFTLAASSDGFLLLKARECGVSAGWLPVLWSGVNAIRAGFSTWGGGLSDRFGRKVLLGSAWLLYAICYAAFASVTTIVGVCAVFAVYAMFGALSEGTERALIADLVPAESRGRAFGWMHGLMGFSALIASVMFGWLWDHYGSRTAFLAGAAPALAAAIALAVLIPGQPGRRVSPKPPPRVAGSIPVPGEPPPRAACFSAAGKLPFMSGPVWKILRHEGTCDSCGETAPELLAVGTVVDFSFRPDSRFCPVCYERYKGRHDELDPKAVAEQKVPPFVSRPN